MDFASPKILYLLLLIPFFVALYFFARKSRQRKLKLFGKPSVVSSLMPMASKYMPPIKLIVSLIALAAIIVVMARPRFGEKEQEQHRQGIEVMIAFDVSRSMLASSNDDAKSVSRLNRAKLILSRLIDTLDDDKVGLIVFAGSSYTLLPLTNDFSVAKMYLNEVSPDMVPTQGTDIGMALNMAMQAFTSEDDVRKAIILITDSEDNEENAVSVAELAAKAGIQIDVIGIGSTRPSPIPLGKGDNRYLTDENGAVVMTSRNDAIAMQIAKVGNGIYIDGSTADATDKLLSHLDNLEKSDFGVVKYKASAEQFPWFAWIALLMLIIDVFLLDRKNGWLHKINFFSKQK